jgi:hypothetical protein
VSREIRADRVKVGDLVSGHPNMTVLAVERFDKPGWPVPWVRLRLHRPASPANYRPVKPEAWPVQELPPDWPVDTWPKVDEDDDEDGGES